MIKSNDTLQEQLLQNPESVIVDHGVEDDEQAVQMVGLCVDLFLEFTSDVDT